jgi:hypothetical protein
MDGSAGADGRARPHELRPSTRFARFGVIRRPRRDRLTTIHLLKIIIGPTGDSIRIMKTLIVGIARSGTSALYFKLRQALPETTWCLYEPPCFDPLDPGGSPNVLAKIVIGPPGEFDCTSFRQFDKKIMIVRDPRDNVISRVLYGPCATEVFRRDKAKIAVFTRALLCKEDNPGSISVLELIELFRHLIGRNSARQPSLLFDLALDLHRTNNDFLVYKYEDFIAGRYAAIEDYLGIELPGGDADVTAQYEHVVGTKAANDWKNWFTADDVEYFRPYLASFMRAYDYPDDWTLAAEPHISPEHGSEFVRRSVAIRSRPEKKLTDPRAA